ncbi:MAG: Rossmann-like and DUF2520 domain-containing protein [Dehalococcoidia bacterium]
MIKPGLKIGFIGIGTVGKGLALALSRQGYLVAGAHNRTRKSAQWLADRVVGCRINDTAQELADAVDLVFITTIDSVIPTVVSGVRWRDEQGVIHCCGAAGRSLLQSAADQGADTAAFHPFQTFAGIDDPDEAVARLFGVTFALSASGWLQEFLQEMAASLGGRTINLDDSKRQQYHASAVLSCGYLATLLLSSLELWEHLGFSQEEAVNAIYPLARITLENIHKRGVSASVTGPVVRGDVETVGSHLSALKSAQPHLVPLYTELTRLSLPLAQQRGVDSGKLSDLRHLIETYSEGSEPCPE